MASEREQFLTIVRRGDVISSRLNEALSSAEISPSLTRWRSFIDNLLLWLGSSAVAAGILFFIAYNWTEMGRFAKFGLVQIVLIAAIVGFALFRQRPVLQKVLLFVSSILVGVLLALFGQTYQTGADPWQLFAFWAVLILPWTIIARFTPLWILFVGLLNVALILYCTAFSPSLPFFRHYEMTLALGLVVLNALALIAWEWRMPAHDWMQELWSPRLLSLGIGIPATLLAIDAVTSSIDATNLVVLVVWVLSIAAAVWFYRHRRADLFMLAGVCFAGIVVVMAWLSKHVFDSISGGGDLLLIAMSIIAMGATAAYWLRNTQRAIEQERP